MPQRNLIRAVISAVCILLSLSAGADVELQKTGSTRKNIQGGYDFRDSAGKKAGYSIPNRRGGYDYYDNRGNLVGRLKKESTTGDSYTYRDAYGIKKGSLKKAPSREYTYKDTQKGELASSIPQVENDLGSLSPDVFQDKSR